MILNYVLKFLDLAWRRVLLALRSLSEFQPLFQTPQIDVELSPITIRAERTGQSSTVAIGRTKITLLSELILDRPRSRQTLEFFTNKNKWSCYRAY